MIKYNDNTINKWYHDGELIKVYYHDAVCYYKLTPSGQTPCFAVVASISQYSDREFVDVFNQADGKWYKLNNLNQYEEYGVYDSTTATTYYDGKLVIEDGYEYQYSGSGWNNVGEISGSSRVPAGYSEVEYIENTGSSYINTTLQLCSATTNTFQVEAKLIPNRIGTQQYQNVFSCMSEAGEPYQGFTYRYYSSTIQGQFIPSNDGSFTQVSNSDGTTSVTASSVNGLTYSHTYPLTICCGLDSNRSPFRYTNTRIYTFKVTLNNGIAADYVPTKRDSDSAYGLYDLISDSFLASPNGNNFVGGSVVTGTTTYPVYYDEIQDPPNNLSFSSMTEAEEYECPWYGMSADIDSTDYMFCEGNEWLTKYTYIEVTGEYLCNNGNKYKKMQEYDRIPDGTTTAHTPATYVIGDLIESASTDCALPYTELQWIEMPQTSPYCAVQLASTYSTSTSLYYDFEILFNSLSDTRIIGFASNSFLIGYNNNSIYLNIGGSRAFTVDSRFTTNTKYHFGLGKRNSSSNSTFNNLDTSTTYATFNSTLPTTAKPYFGAINAPSLLVNGESERIYSIKVYDNEVLVGNYIPVKRNSDNFVTLYDTVSEQFCDTVGGGTMVAGPTV